jgi:hypothetical protein
MTDRPASWRMPTPKQMEKLAAEAARRPGRSAAAPDAPLPAEYWESVLKDPRAGATGGQMRQRRLSEVQRRASPAAAASGPRKSRPPMQSDYMAATRSGRTSRSDCSTTPASSVPAGMKKTAAGRRSRRRSLLRICRSDLFAPGCPDGTEVSPYARMIGRLVSINMWLLLLWEPPRFETDRKTTSACLDRGGKGQKNA